MKLMATFIYPTKVRRMTSGFRTKARPNHHGVDFAQAGTHEIYAVADGEVSRSYTSSSYGEVVFILHKINGVTWETVYAHLRKGSRRVKAGDKIKQGQVIGIMGSTGDSTGQHLHFELHKGRWNINKTNAVDPMKYLGKDLYPKKQYITYTVKGGDTLSELARQYKTTVNEIVALNPEIESPHLIYVGQKIKIPTNTSSTFKVGQKVKIKSSAQFYSRTRNVTIPARVKNKTYTIQQVGKDDVLLKEIFSWVAKKDLITL